MKYINTAVILAAGRGSRLKELSLEQPKPMTEVNNTGILNNLVGHLINAGLSRIVVVTGYFADKLQKEIMDNFENQAEFIFVENKIFNSTNNIYSLWLAAEYLKEGFYLFEADVFCDYDLIKQIVEHKAENITLLGTYTELMNGTVVDLNSSELVENMYLKRHQVDDFSFEEKYKTINFYKLSKKFIDEFFLDKLEEHIKNDDVNSYYELIIKEAIDLKYPFAGLRVGEAKWWEIDTIEDLQIAENLFAEK